MAVFDCNQDLLPEVFMAGGENLSSLYLNVSEFGGSLRFQKHDNLQIRNVTGAYPIDVDSDELIDLVVLRVGRNSIFKGLGNCQFIEANHLWNFEGGNDWSTAFSATWLAEDNWPTLAVGNYIDQSQAQSPFGTCLNHQILKPKPQSFESQIISPGYCALSMLFSDWDRYLFLVMARLNDPNH